MTFLLTFFNNMYRLQRGLQKAQLTPHVAVIGLRCFWLALEEVNQMHLAIVHGEGLEAANGEQRRRPAPDTALDKVPEDLGIDLDICFFSFFVCLWPLRMIQIALDLLWVCIPILPL